MVQDVNIDGVTRRPFQQRLFPAINFRCSGRIAKLIIGASMKKSSSNSSEFEIQVWRPDQENDNDYTKVYGFTPGDNELKEVSSYSNVYEHNLTSMEIHFTKGDVLGIYYGKNDKKFDLYNQKLTGPINFQLSRKSKSPESALSNLNEASKHDYPLVSVEVGKYIRTLCVICNNMSSFRYDK